MRLDLYVLAAKSEAIMENPKRSLFYFEKALPLVTNSSDKKSVLFGIVKMQIWLNMLNKANNTLDKIQLLSLTKDEKIQLHQLRAKAKINHASNKKDDNLDRINRYIDNGDGVRAYYLINQSYKDEYNSRRYRLMAESMAEMNRPVKSLEFYQKAFSTAKTRDEQKAALFGIGKIDIWLANYVRAERTFRMLLTYYPLSHDEYQTALAGLVKSLAYYDRTRSAYHAIPPNLIFTDQKLVIAAGQAALWSGWNDIAKCILCRYKNITDQIDLNSALGADYKDLKWQTDLTTAPDVVTPTYFFSHDSDNFDKRQATLDYTHYWSQIIQTSIGLQSTKYTQIKPEKLHASGFYVGGTLNPTRQLSMSALLQPNQYKNDTTGQRNTWNLLLWNFHANYTFNDYISANILALREVVETFPAFNNHITDKQYSVGLNINPLPYINFNGSLYQLDFSDTNRRPGYYSSASVLFAPNIGLSLLGVFRGYTDKFTSPDYFSPHKYMSESLILKLGRRLGATWHYYIDAGSGRQFITPFNSPTSSGPIWQWGAGINGPLSEHFIFSAYYSDIHQASGFANSSNYDYKYGGVSINIIL